MRFSTLTVFAIVTSGLAAAQAPSGWSDLGKDYSYGTVYSADGSEDGLRMLIKSRAEIEDSCYCNLDQKGGDTVEEKLLFGLSTMSIDVDDYKASDKAIAGMAYTEFGEQSFMANIDQSGGDLRVVVVIGPSDTFAKFAKSGVVPQAKEKAVATAKPAPKRQASTGKYNAPKIVKNRRYQPVITNWDSVGHGQFARKNDPKSPFLRSYTFTGDADQSAKSLATNALKKFGLSTPRFAVVEQLEVTKKMTGTTVFIAFGTAKLDGSRARFYANIRTAKGSRDPVVQIYAAPRDTYVEWGGVAVPMSLVGIYETKDWTPAALQQAAAIAPADEAVIFEDHYTKKMMSLFQGTMATQAGTLNAMRSFNMSTATCAGMENCAVVSDAVGGYTAQIE